MATHDYIISNASGASVRADLNNALAAIVSNNSNATSPATTYAYQWWADTTTGQLKLRNSANNAWITIFELDGTMLMEDGSVSAPGLAFASDLNTGFFRSAADKINFATGGAERLEIGSSEVVFNDPSNDVDFRVESNGNTHMLFVDAGNDRIGIGTTSPTAPLTVQGDTNANGVRLLGRSSDDRADLQFYENDGLTFVAGLSAELNSLNLFLGSASGELKITGNKILFRDEIGSERARVDTSGRLLIGSSSSRANGYGDNASLQLEGTSYPKAAISTILNSNNANGPSINFAKTRGTSNGSSTVVQSGDTLGVINFVGGDGTDITSPAAKIRVEVDGTPGSNDMPGRIVFDTTPDGSASPSERLRIDSSGRLLVGTTTEGEDNADNLTIADSASAGITIRSGTTHYGSIYFSDATSGTGEFDGFLVYNQSSRQLTIGTASSTRMLIDSSGNTGIGEESPDAKLHIRDSTDGGSGDTKPMIQFSRRNGGANDAILQAVHDGADGISALRLDLAGSERIRIDSSGRLLAGTTVTSGGNQETTAVVGGCAIHSTGLRSVSANGTLDLSSIGTSIVGHLYVHSVSTANAASRTSKVFFVAGRLGNNTVITELNSNNGSTSGKSFTVTNPSNNILRFTETSNTAVSVTMSFVGSVGF